MDISTATVSPLRQRMLDDMRMRKMAEHTQDGYIRAVRKLATFLGRSPDAATARPQVAQVAMALDWRAMVPISSVDRGWPRVRSCASALASVGSAAIQPSARWNRRTAC